MAMTEKEFAKIVRKIRADWPKFLEESWQFQEWYDDFKDVDFDVAMEAARTMLRMYAYQPVRAQYWARIEEEKRWREKKKEDRARAKANQVDPREAEKAQKAAKRYSRFVQFLIERHIKWADWTQEKFEAELDKFEKDKETRNWQPRSKRKNKGPSAIRDLLPDALKEKP